MMKQKPLPYTHQDVTFFRKQNSRRQTTMDFSENIVVAETIKC